MGYILRLPSINAATDTEKIEQIRRYLYQTIKEINWALNTLDASTPEMVEANEASADSTFALIKPMIIKSSEIINAYYTNMKSRFDDVYAPKADFEKLNAWMKVNDDSLEIGRMIDGIFVSMMRFTDSGEVDISQLPIVGDIEVYAESLQGGMAPICSSEYTIGLPDGFEDCVGTINKVGSKIIIQLTSLTTGSIASKVFNGTWGDWKYLNPQ